MLRRSGAALLSATALAGCAQKGGSSSCCNSTATGSAAGGCTKPYRLALNASTIAEYKLPVLEQIALVAKAGYDGIELWTRDIEAFQQGGGKLSKISEALEKSGLRYENTIGFSRWMSDDEAESNEGMRLIEQEMKMTKSLGGHAVAATALGVEKIDLERLPIYGAKYAKVLEMAKQHGLMALLEVWGSGALYKTSWAMAIAAEARRADAAFLLDFYHLFRGGNDFDSLALINPKALPLFHINDYPADPPREKMGDGDRVYPGDGICPWNEVLPLMASNGYCGGFSLELFNKGYQQAPDPMTVLSDGLQKCRAVLETHFTPYVPK